MSALKVQDLTGPLLARAVAMALGKRVEQEGDESWVVWHASDDVQSFGPYGWRPDLNWGDTGHLLDYFDIMLDPNKARAEHVKCRAVMDAAKPLNTIFNNRVEGWGPTNLIAACRAIVAAHYGDTMPEDFQ